MQTCMTIPFLPEFSGCLVENPACHFAIRCGFSYHCHHPNHADFHTIIDASVQPTDLPERYQALRESRRLKFLKDISELPTDLGKELQSLLGRKL